MEPCGVEESSKLKKPDSLPLARLVLLSRLSSPDDELTTVSSFTGTDLYSPTSTMTSPFASPSPEVEGCAKGGQVIHLPHFSSAQVWSDGMVKDAQTQTDSQIEFKNDEKCQNEMKVQNAKDQSVQTELSRCLESYIEWTVAKMLFQAFLTVSRNQTESQSNEAINRGQRSTLCTPTFEDGGSDSGLDGDLRSVDDPTPIMPKLASIHREIINVTNVKRNDFSSSAGQSERDNEMNIETNEAVDNNHLIKKETYSFISCENSAQILNDICSTLAQTVDTIRIVVEEGSNVDLTAMKDAGLRDKRSEKSLAEELKELQTEDALELLATQKNKSTSKDLEAIVEEDETEFDERIEIRVLSPTTVDVNSNVQEVTNTLRDVTKNLHDVEEEIIQSLRFIDDDETPDEESSECPPPPSNDVKDKQAAVGKWLTVCQAQRTRTLSPIPEQAEESISERSCSPEPISFLSEVSSIQEVHNESNTTTEEITEESRRSSVTGESIADSTDVSSSVPNDNSSLDSKGVNSKVVTPSESVDSKKSASSSSEISPFVLELKARLQKRREEIESGDEETNWLTQADPLSGTQSGGVSFGHTVNSNRVSIDDSRTRITEEATTSGQFKADRIWSPGQLPPVPSMERSDSSGQESKEDKENLSPIWQPFGPLDEKPTFRSVQLDASKPTSPTVENSSPQYTYANSSSSQQVQPIQISSNIERKIGSPSSPITLGVSSGLPQYQNPTITLLQKAREGQLPKGAIYLDQHLPSEDDIPKDAVLVDQRVTVEGDQIHTDSYYALPTKEISARRVTTIKAPEKYEGIGPTEKGIPISLRTGVKEEYASDWYKTMFKSLHKFEKPSDDYQTIRYGKKVGRVPHSGGYMSEPEFERDENSPYSNKYATIDHRRLAQQRNREPKPSSVPSSQQIRFNTYHNQPRSIAEYEPGHSSIAEREVRLQSSRYLPSVDLPNTNYIDGYESDSTLIRKTGKSHLLDPTQQKAWYREVQKGGDIPFSGLGKPAPDRPKLSPHRYQETEVNIHYRTPVRNLEKEFIEEEELRKRQETAMKKFYEEERYKKQMQQLQEIEMRRHGDNFMPAQKSPIPLNRYDEPFEIPKSPLSKTPEPRSMAKVLYNFYAQTARELSIIKDEIVYIIKKVDKNWYEGEHNGTVGIFPVSYVEVIATSNQTTQALKPHEGQGRAKYNFKAQSPVELSLFKGETIVLTRKVDGNWFEGRIGSKKGIFPTSYIEVLSFPGEKSGSSKDGKSHSAVNGSHSARQAFRSREAFSTYPTTSQSASHEDSYSISSFEERKQPITESLHVDTHTEPIPYRALYTYRPQNEDELELTDGDTVYVMEKCDDGWFVGTSLRTGLFGTFPGNYVERI